MIASLADAWDWYEGVRTLTLAMQALGRKHWDSLPWDTALGRDERLRHLEAPRIENQADAVLGDLDDLCVLLMFSVFEAAVRERVLDEVGAEQSSLRHPAIRYAVAALTEGIEHGSFYRVLELYKDMDAGLVEGVNQVRRYRNWVAHGRRGEPQSSVTPPVAYERLQRFLAVLTPSAPGPEAGPPAPADPRRPQEDSGEKT